MNILSRRSFLERSTLAGAGLGLAALTNVPLVVKRALAASNIGTGGKKIFFIFLRGANDGLNALAPINDPNYTTARTVGGAPGTAGQLALPKDPGADAASYAATTEKIGFSNPFFNVATGGIESGSVLGAYDAYPYAIACRDGFSALHPSHKFLLPVYNNGDLAIIHRVGYPRQSRSHFDSQNYYENGIPGNNTKREGILYRAMNASGLANTQALTGVSLQSALPLILQGDAAAMTNLSDPTRYDLFGIPANASGNSKVDRFVSNANTYPFPTRNYRDLIQLQYKNLGDTLNTFAAMKFGDADNKFFDDVATDGDSVWHSGVVADGSYNKPAGHGYWLFPHNNNSNGGWRRPSNATVANKYVLGSQGGDYGNYYGYMRNVKAAAMVLNYTDAICAGTEIGGFDTHVGQIGTGDPLVGQHPSLQRAIAWTVYALYKYFTLYGLGGSKVGDSQLPPSTPTPKATWNNVVVVTMSEFGRTSVQNGTTGSDHAEANVMWVAGGNVKGFGGPNNGGTGIYGCNTDAARSTYNGNNVQWTVGTPVAGNTNATGTGTLFDAAGRYLRRAVDYRSVLGEIIREHLGATQPELDYIIPGYAVAGEKLKLGGAVTAPIDPTNTTIAGEVDVI